VNETCTFLFTDIEGSTRLWEQEPVRMPHALARHDALARAAVAGCGGNVVKMVGDGLHAVFDDPGDAVRAALQAQLALVDPAATHGIPLRMRCGIHVGPVERRDSDYFGSVVNRAARIMSSAHGGQVLLSQAVAESIGARLPPEAALRDLGTVRLRDLASPERVFQLVHPALRRDFPALRSLEATPNNLPQQVTSFIGRAHALADVKALLAKARLLTLVGTGGLGKTRLSLQAAADVIDDYADGVWFVELAPIADGRLVAQAVASTLGVIEESGRSALDALTKFVTDRSLLVVLDNCEHLIDACAELANRLLQAGARLKVLASSREPLRVPGETTYPLPALSLPDARAPVAAATLTEFDAVRLFVDRARAVQPSFAVTAQNAPAVAVICRQLDGVPLALELAAARVGSLPVETIADRLTDRFRLLTRGSRAALPRQQTLRALIDWSYDLLFDAEKKLFTRVAVFAGSFTLEAVEAASAGDGIDAGDVVDLLTALVEKSLVERDAGGSRYRLLETVRQYAHDRLRESGDEARWQARHCAHFLALAEAAEPHLTGAEQQMWLDKLEAEHDNFRAALAWASGGGDAARGLRLGGALWLFWYVRGHPTEGRRWLAALLAAVPEGDVATRAKVLRGAGVMAYDQGDYAASRASHEACLALRRELGDRRGIAAQLGSLGIVACDQGDYAHARALLEQSLAIQRELGDRRGIAMSLNNLGALASDQGDHAAARVMHEESLAIKRELGDRRGIAMSLNNLGLVAADQHDYASARALHEESLASRRELADPSGIAMSLNNLGEIAYKEGEHAAARALHEQCLTIRRELGDRRGIADSLESLGYVALAEDRPDTAARMLGAAARLREDIGAPLPGSARAHYDERVAALRLALGDAAAFERGWNAGRAMAMEDAIRHALGEGRADSPQT
jgi:predicted ATPase/class 3 adenylate cyclase